MNKYERSLERSPVGVWGGPVCPRLAAGQKASVGLIHVDERQLLNTTLADDWPSYNGDYTGRRYSNLSQVTPANVSGLSAQWVFHSRNAGTLELTPIVVAGSCSSRNRTISMHLTRRRGRRFGTTSGR